ncbi:MAG: hypothetical protein M3Q16_03555 [Pseudomonadota bacterium]|nr:hypothetical protein [Pseudomonadota bacterium]
MKTNYDGEQMILENETLPIADSVFVSEIAQPGRAEKKRETREDCLRYLGYSDYAAKR